METNIRIYYNEQCIYICEKANELIKQEEISNAWIVRSTREESLKDCFFAFIESDFDNLILEGDTSDVFDEFEDIFELIQAGGGVVTNEDGDLLMIYRLGKWDLPKGKLELGEELAMCAVREVEEETGLDDISISGILKSTYHIYQEEDYWVLKQTEWYEMKAPKQDLTPQAEEDILEAVWIDKEKLTSCLENSYPNILFLLNSIEEAIEE